MVSQLTRAGVLSTFPAASIARTSSTCRPGSTLNLVDALQAVKRFCLSSLHWNVEPGSLELTRTRITRFGEVTGLLTNRVAGAN